MGRAIIYSMLLVLFSCGQQEQTNIRPAEPAAADNTVIVKPDSLLSPGRDTMPYNIQVDSVIHLSFAKDSAGVSVKGHLDKEGGPVICYLEAANSGWLHASLVPEKKNVNLRFSHIYMPNGESDGPFGQTLKYRLSNKGKYRLYIAPNQMAGDKREGNDFTLHISVR